MPMIERTKVCILLLQVDVGYILTAAIQAKLIKRMPEVQDGKRVPVRAPREILLELVWRQMFEAQVKAAEARPEGLREEDLKRSLGMFTWTLKSVLAMDGTYNGKSEL